MGDNMVGECVSLILIGGLQGSNDEGRLILRNVSLSTINTNVLVKENKRPWATSLTWENSLIQ